jgi:hypothetical protein
MASLLVYKSNESLDMVNYFSFWIAYRFWISLVLRDMLMFLSDMVLFLSASYLSLSSISAFSLTIFCCRSAIILELFSLKA